MQKFLRCLAVRHMHNGWPGCTQAGATITRSISSFEREEMSITIDRSGLILPKERSHSEQSSTELARQIEALIKFRGGPITVAEYMSEVLTNPQAGYYSRNEVFGSRGDFVTSPEISQLFGEMVGVWCVMQWQQLGSPAQMDIVELGPGRGTLMTDLLRSTSCFAGFRDAISVRLVEVSRAMEERQREALNCTPEEAPTGGMSKVNTMDLTAMESTSARWTCAINGSPVTWHRSLDAVPRGVPCVVIAHEFFDALPVHQFARTERGWVEKLVDVAEDGSDAPLRFVLSPGPTPASRILLPRRLTSLPAPARDGLNQLEVSAQGIALAGALGARIAEQGCAALVVDYGRDAVYGDSLLAICAHEHVDPLARPGEADLSCHVDFSALRQGVQQSGATAHGPIPQAHFLVGMGIEARLDALLQSTSDTEQQAALIHGYNRLVGGGEPTSSSVVEAEQAGSAGLECMGYSYKVMAITPADAPAPLPFPGSGISIV